MYRCLRYQFDQFETVILHAWHEVHNLHVIFFPYGFHNGEIYPYSLPLENVVIAVNLQASPTEAISMEDDELELITCT